MQPLTGGAAGATSQLTYEEIIESLLRSLAQAGALAPDAGPVPWDAFLRLSTLIHDRYEVPSTTFTAEMRRLVFALGYAARSARIVGIGTYVGYPFSWLLRDRSDLAAAPFFDMALGIDISAEANEVARRNCAMLGHGERLAFIDADAIAAIGDLEPPIDLLYVDLDDPVSGKAGYRDVLAAAVPHLRPGALVLAHDPCVARFARDFALYRDFVRGSGLFAGYWLLPVDACGLSLAVAR